MSEVPLGNKVTRQPLLCSTDVFRYVSPSSVRSGKVALATQAGRPAGGTPGVPAFIVRDVAEKPNELRENRTCKVTIQSLR